jgi:hypothetical protein
MAPDVIPPVILMAELEVPVCDAETSIKTVAETHKSNRVRDPPQWFHNEVFILDDDEPVNYKEEMADPSSNEWLKAMISEMESMYENQVWNLVDPPEGSKPIESKWIFKRKTDADDNVTIHKARLVLKGFRQVQ